MWRERDKDREAARCRICLLLLWSRSQLVGVDCRLFKITDMFLKACSCGNVSGLPYLDSVGPTSTCISVTAVSGRRIDFSSYAMRASSLFEVLGLLRVRCSG